MDKVIRRPKSWIRLMHSALCTEIAGGNRPCSAFTYSRCADCGNAVCYNHSLYHDSMHQRANHE